MPELTLPHLLLANASFVTPGLAVGGDLAYDRDTAGAQLAELVGCGLTHIIDVRLEWSDEEFVAGAAPQVGYFHHGVDDAGQCIPDGWFDAGVGYALDALAGPAAVVLVHCHMGINRGPSLGYAILLAQGWDPVAALDAVRAARPIAAVAYAEDALRWHHARTGTPAVERAQDRAGVAQWRSDNQLDTASIIRRLRRAGA